MSFIYNSQNNITFKKLNGEFLNCYLQNLKNIIITHKILLKSFIENNATILGNIRLIENQTIPINSEIEIILMSHIFEYRYTLNQTIKQN